MKVKVALYELYGGKPEVCQTNDYRDGDSDYLRVSESLEIEIELQPDEIIIPKKLERIDAAADKVREEAQKKLNRLEEERAKLLALPNLSNTEDS